MSIDMDKVNFDDTASGQVIDKCTICDVDVGADGVPLNGNLLCFSCYSTGQDSTSMVISDSDPDDQDSPPATPTPTDDSVTKADIPESKSSPNLGLRCAICRKIFRRKGNLVTHLRRHNKLNCKVCARDFRTMRQLKVHKKRHVRKSVNNTLIFCEVCKKYFKTKKGFAYHQEKICVQYKCYICGESFLVHSMLQDHMKANHDGAQPKAEWKPASNEAAGGECEKVMSACLVCGKVVTPGVIDRHMLLHSKEKPFTCDLCGKQFKRKHSLQDHIMIEMGMKNYVCDICGMKFLKQGYLNKHVRYHKLNNGEFVGFQCEVCSKRFPEKWRLGVHQRAVHKGGEFASCRCDICDKQFAERWMVRKHKHIEHGGDEFKEYICSTCGKTFQEKWMIRSHERSTHRNRQKREYCDLCGRNDHASDECEHRQILTQVKCELCGESFSGNIFLKEHVSSVHEIDVKVETVVEGIAADTWNGVVHLCVGCGQDFVSKKDLKAHESNSNCRKQDIKYECVECGKAYTSKFSLSNHLMAHKKASAKVSFRCDSCDKDFMSVEALETHMSMDKICLLCNQVYPCNDQLKNHVFVDHNDDPDETNTDDSSGKPFECKLCGKAFARKQAMKNHLFAEMNLRRYTCEFCDKSYNYFSHLKEHIVTNHGEREHICGYCGKDFPTLKRFRDHVSLHSEDKPFACVCGSTFKLSRYLNKHKKHCKLGLE